MTFEKYLPHAIIPDPTDLMAVDVNHKIWKRVSKITKKKVSPFQHFI